MSLTESCTGFERRLFPFLRDDSPLPTTTRAPFFQTVIYTLSM